MQQFFDVVQTRSGAAIAGVSVTVYNSSGGAATLYSDNGVTPKANPVTTNADGEYFFYAANDTYSLGFSSPAYVSETRTGIVLFDPAQSTASSNVSYNEGGTGAVTRTVQAKLQESVSVKDFGAVGNGVTNDTVAVQAALDSGSGAVFFPAGTYLVSPINIPANSVIKTDGFSTIFKRNTSSTNGLRTLNVTGSNVIIESFSGIGDIATGTGEQNHLLYVVGNATNGAINNVTIGDIQASNVRGDALYLGANTGYPLTNVRVGLINGTNILRNVISIVGCDGLEIDGVTGTNVGLFTFDIEPESTNTPVNNVQVGYIKGKSVACISASTTNYADKIQFRSVDVDPTVYGVNSTPAYSSGGEQSSGLIIRNTKSISLDSFVAKNYKSMAIDVVYNVSEIGCEDLHIGYCNLTNCSTTEATYLAYIQTQNILRFTCNNFVVDASATTSNRRIFLYGANIVLDTVNATLASGVSFSTYATRLDISSGVVSSGIFIIGAVTGSIRNVAFNGVSLATFCSPLLFENVTATCSSNVFNSSYDIHQIINSTLNTDYFANGGTSTDATTNYLRAQRFGSYRLWVSSDGKLRIKSSAPTSDTDGTVVGTQT